MLLLVSPVPVGLMVSVLTYSSGASSDAPEGSTRDGTSDLSGPPPMMESRIKGVCQKSGRAVVADINSKEESRFVNSETCREKAREVRKSEQERGSARGRGQRFINKMKGWKIGVQVVTSLKCKAYKVCQIGDSLRRRI